MPITQERMLQVLEEASRLEDWTNALRHDVRGILDSVMSSDAKLEALAAILDISHPPACTQLAIERDHFRRARQRNIKSARRMRLAREHQHHGGESNEQLGE